MRQVFPFALQNTQIVSTEKIPIPTQGKGVFTTIKVVGGISLFLEKHLARLTDNAHQIGIPVSLSQIANQIQTLLTANNTTNAAVRISIVEDGTVFFHSTTLPQTVESISAISIESKELLPTIKQLDRSIYIKALEQAHTQGSDTALFVHQNYLLESPISNIISSDSEGMLVTPVLTDQGLKGIMRNVLLEKGVLKEQKLSFATNQPIILINCLRIQAISSINGKKLPDPATLLRQVQKCIHEEEKAYENSYYR